MKKKYDETFFNFCKANIKGTPLSELVIMINSRFDMNITREQLSRYCSRKQLRNGLNCCFKKGNVPANKGVKMSPEKYAKCQKTMFKKGNIPYNHKPVGTERIGKDDYIYIKTGEPNKWQLKHHFLYEKQNGKIPDGCIVIFLDGNKNNFDLENLTCISRGENAVLNKLKLRTNDKDFTSISINIAKIKMKTTEAKEKLNKANSKKGAEC